MARYSAGLSCPLGSGVSSPRSGKRQTVSEELMGPAMPCGGDTSRLEMVGVGLVPVVAMGLGLEVFLVVVLLGVAVSLLVRWSC